MERGVRAVLAGWRGAKLRQSSSERVVAALQPYINVLHNVTLTDDTLAWEQQVWAELVASTALVTPTEEPDLRELLYPYRSDLRHLLSWDDTVVGLRFWLEECAQRAQAREDAPGQRIEQYLRLDTYLLSDRAQAERRPVTDLLLRKRERGGHLRFEYFSYAELPRRPHTLIRLVDVSVARLAWAYRSGFPISDVELRYPNWGQRTIIVHESTWHSRDPEEAALKRLDDVRDFFGTLLVEVPSAAAG